MYGYAWYKVQYPAHSVLFADSVDVCVRIRLESIISESQFNCSHSPCVRYCSLFVVTVVVVTVVVVAVVVVVVVVQNLNYQHQCIL